MSSAALSIPPSEPEGYRLIEVRPLAGAIGAEIFGVDLSGELDAATFGEIRRAFHEYLAIFFRDQDLDPLEQRAFAARFGTPQIYPFVKGMEGCPEVIEIVKEAHEVQNFGGFWHSDTAYLATPPLGTMLYALQVPPAGGDTMFANGYLAYETLSETMRGILDGLVGINSATLRIGGEEADAKSSGRMRSANLERMADHAEHPVVRTHPETGRRALYVNGAHTAAIKGMTKAESRALLDFLFAHAVQAELTCRFRWQPGSLAFWDNRCCQHFALNDYQGHRRHMRRITIEGDRPR